MLDATEEALDQVAVFVLVAIESALNDAMAARRDDGFDPLIVKMFENGVGVVRLVRTERVGLQSAEQGQRLWAIPRLTAGQAESGKHSQPFDQGVDFRAQSAARAPERLIPFF